MSGFVTEVLPEKIDACSKKLRLCVRRMYLRKGIKKYGASKKTLTKEQLRAAKAYWSKYTKHFSPLWHALFTARTGVFDVRYVPVDIQFTEIEERLNDWASAHGIDNKNNYSMYFPEVRHPKSVFRKMHGLYHDDAYRIISEEQAIQNCIDQGDVIFKVAVESGKGLGISFWRTEDGEQKLREMIKTLPKETNAQEFVKQHPALAAINAASVNTIRIITYASEQGVKWIGSYFQVGRSDVVRQGQVALGGVCVSVHADGTLYPYAVDTHYQRSTQHPNGLIYDGFKLPSFDKVVDAAKRLHQKIGDFRIISWDFTVAPDGEPIFIEMNLKYGGVMFHQLSAGPLFGDDTEAILDEIYGKKA